MKKKLKKIKRLINSLQNDSPLENVSTREKCSKKSDHFIHTSSKKTRRRSKALKLKINRIKNQELTERCQSVKKTIQVPKSGSSLELEDLPREDGDKSKFMIIPQDILDQQVINLESDENVDLNPTFVIPPVETGPIPLILEPEMEKFIYPPEENPIVTAILVGLREATKQLNDVPKIPPTSTQNDEKMPSWKSFIFNLPFSDVKSILYSMRYDLPKLQEAFLHLKKLSKNETLEKNPKNLGVIIDYLSDLLKIILESYQFLWNNDRNLDNNYLVSDFSKDTDNKKANSKHQRKIEKQHIDDVLQKFDILITTIKNLYLKNPALCLENICRLEETLYKFKIRGVPLYTKLCSTEIVNIKYSLFNVTKNEDNDGFIDQYMEDVLNNRIDPNDHIDIKIDQDPSDRDFLDCITPIEMYHKELEKIPIGPKIDPLKAFRDKQKTLDHAYHLVDSIMAICESDDEPNDSKRSDNYNSKLWFQKTKSDIVNLCGGAGGSEGLLESDTDFSFDKQVKIEEKHADNVDILSIETLEKEKGEKRLETTYSPALLWDSDKKWLFLQTCAGINVCLSLNDRLDEFHLAIENMLLTNNIKSDWIEAVQKKFPKIAIFQPDTITGLLKFIREYFSDVNTSFDDDEGGLLCNEIMLEFPLLPYLLFRLLENTHWMLYPVFAEFTSEY